MNLVIDTSVVIAILVNEPERQKIISRTIGVDLVAPGSVHWEVGNALSALRKRKKATEDQIQRMLQTYKRIPIRLVDVDMTSALQVSSECNLYAHDAYLIQCAKENRCDLMSLDVGLLQAARKSQVGTVEIQQ